MVFGQERYGYNNIQCPQQVSILVVDINLYLYWAEFNNGICLCWMYNLTPQLTTHTLPITYKTKYTPVCGGGWLEQGCWPAVMYVNLSQIKAGSRGTASYAGQQHVITIGY